MNAHAIRYRRILLAACLLVGCRATIPDGKVRCSSLDDCPPSFKYCRAPEPGAQSACYRDAPASTHVDESSREPDAGEARPKDDGAGSAAHGGDDERAGTGGVPAAHGGSGGADVVTRAGSGGSNACPHASELSEVQISSLDLGPLPASEALGWRAGMTAVRYDDRVVWFFEETAEGPATVNWSGVRDVLRMPPLLDDSKPAEPLFVGSLDRSAMPIPTTAWLDEQQNITFFYSIFDHLTANSVGVARIAAGETVASVQKEAGQLFASESGAAGRGASMWRPEMMTGTFLENDFYYTYACQGRRDIPEEQPNGSRPYPCRALRVPRAQLLDGNSYTYWNGQTWTADADKAVPVINHIFSGMTVSYNAYLGAYLAVSSGNNELVFYSASAPTGPFRQLAKVRTLVATWSLDGSDLKLTYAGGELVTLREDCDRVLYASYILPLINPDGSVRKETRLQRVELQ
jgi:hypothetical protein